MLEAPAGAHPGGSGVLDEVFRPQLVQHPGQHVRQVAVALEVVDEQLKDAVVVLVVEDDPLLRAEVPVDRRGGHLGFLGHLFDGHGREAALGEQRQGGFLYPPHGREFFSLSQGKLGHGHLLVTTSLA